MRYWEKKGIYNEHQQQELQAIDQKRNAYLAKYALTSLTPEEFDRTTGAVNWPKVLDQKQYDQYRQTLTKLFQQRAYTRRPHGRRVHASHRGQQSNGGRLLSSQQNVYPITILSQMIRFILKLDRELDDNLG